MPFPFTPTRRNRLDDIRVRDLMTADPVSVRHGISVREAAAFLAARGIGAAPVVNDAGRAVGVLSRSDVLLAATAGVDAAPVREVMTPAVIAVGPDGSTRDAADALVRHAVRRVFVVDEEGVPIGVVTASDLFRALVAAWGDAADAVPVMDAGDRRPPARPDSVPVVADGQMIPWDTTGRRHEF